jgi:predicted ATPase
LLELLASGVTYLGPLRQEPQVIYKTYSPAQPRNLGSKGEYTAPVMYRMRDAKVVVPMPGEPSREVTLQDAANAWLAELGAATSIEVLDAGRLGYDVRVAQPGLASTVDLTAVGVGVSQVVPVVLACLLSEPGGVVLLEQPELHLHPAMQQRLADFFLALANSGRQLIVETHSEYLITRLRLRVAEDRTNHVADLLGFINASKNGPRTEFKQVTVNRYGSFEEWPEGFFDQAAEDSQALLLEGLKKKAGD